MGENVVLLAEDGTQIGVAEKLSIHHADTPLHLAFSCYIFNKDGKILLTRRANQKKVWPGFYTNSVCGHPLPGESMEDAILRRATFELGISSLRNIKTVLPDYRYKTPPYNGVVEYEVCPVFVALTDQEPRPNPLEVEEYAWVTWEEYCNKIAENADKFSYWSKDQLAKLQNMLINPKDFVC